MLFKVNLKTIEISENLLSIFNIFRQKDKTDHESGGILLGQIKENYIYISKASTPNKFDFSSPNSFIRDHRVAQLIVNYEFYNSNGRLIYIGEWHTHNENYPSPSQIDIQMIKGQYKDNILNEEYIILIIIGKKGIYLGLYDGNKLHKGKIIKK